MTQFTNQPADIEPITNGKPAEKNHLRMDMNPSEQANPNLNPIPRVFTGMTALFAILVLSLTACEKPQSFFEGNEINTDRLTRIDDAMQKFVDEELVAGAVGLVMRDGKIIYENAVGYIDREEEREMPADAIFRIASQSKAITSVGILMLVEEGKIALEDPVSNWMPTFETTTVVVSTDTGYAIVPANRPITIQDLLTHTAGISYGGNAYTNDMYAESGLGYGEAYGWYTAHKDEPICETMDKLGDLPFAQQPGADFVYGYNTDILGCVIERASGLPFDEFLEERITGPLGMTDTHFYLPEEDRDRLAVVYTPAEDGRVVRADDSARGQGHYVDGPRVSFAGGAGLLSTARDYARFLEMVRSGGTLDGVQYLAPHTVALMATNLVGDLHNENGLGFGLGFQTVDRFGAGGYASKGSFGWSGAYGTVYEIDPQERMVLVMMIQVVPYVGRGIREAFKTAVYQSLSSPAAL